MLSVTHIALCVGFISGYILLYLKHTYLNYNRFNLLFFTVLYGLPLFIYLQFGYLPLYLILSITFLTISNFIEEEYLYNKILSGNVRRYLTLAKNIFAILSLLFLILFLMAFIFELHDYFYDNPNVKVIKMDKNKIEELIKQVKK